MLRFYANGSPSYILAEPSLAIQIQDLLQSFIDTTAAHAGLLFHLREFSFTSHSGLLGETGYCTIRAGLYVRHAKNVYQLLSTLDTIVVKKKLLVKNALFKDAENLFVSLIAGNLLKKPSDTTVYSTADIKFIEAQEKRILPLYTRDTLTDGIYRTYKSFSNQIPDKAVVVIFEGNVIKSVKAVNEKGELIEINPENIYAFIYQGRAYISTEYGYSLVTRKKDDFYYSGKSSVNANGAHVANAQFNYGLLGGLIAANENGVYEIKLTT